MVSLEALAMAGTNGVECSMDFEEWELNDLEQYPPPHLLAQEEEDDDNNNNNKSSINGAIKELGKEDYGVIVTNHEEKWNTTVEIIIRPEKCSRLILARAMGILISLSCVINTRD
jgi:hypothetical protein